MAQPDVLVIGGGVIGASIAYYLSEQGTSVTLLERGRAGGHASLASAGLLHPMQSAGVPEPLRAFSAASFALFPGLVARLRELTGIDPEFQPNGWLKVASNQDEAAELRAREMPDAMAREYGLEYLSGEEARALEPALSPVIVAAIRFPRGAHVYVPSLLQAYTHAAARLGATVRRGVEVVELRVERNRVAGARTADGEEVLAGHTVLAGGAWSALTGRQLGVALPVFPLRGQILSLYAIPAPLRHVVFGAAYLAPKADGSVVVGATYEDAGFDDRLTAEGVGWLLGAAQRVVPVLAGATYRQAWVGLRPASRDGLPLLGPVPGWEGITVATGHLAEGILNSPITGKVIAQHIRGEKTDVALDPFSVSRFAASSPGTV